MRGHSVDDMIAVTVSEPAGPDSIELVEFPDPVAGRGELLVATLAATVNPVDQGLVGGAMTERISAVAPPPWTPGWDLAGTVAAVGEGVDPAWIGKTVLGFSPWFQSGNGTQAGMVTLPLAQLVAASGVLTAVELTTFGLNGLTALHLLRSAADSTGPGATSVLVTGAAGGVGKLTVELGVNAGFTVIACAGEKDRAELEATGAHFIPREVGDLAVAVRELVPGGVDAALNTVPAPATGLGAVRDGGRYRSVSVLPDPERGIDVGRVGVKADADGLAQILALAESGAITTRVAATFTVADAAAAYRAASDGSRGRGKIVLSW